MMAKSAIAEEADRAIRRAAWAIRQMQRAAEIDAADHVPAVLPAPTRKFYPMRDRSELVETLRARPPFVRPVGYSRFHVALPIGITRCGIEFVTWDVWGDGIWNVHWESFTSDPSELKCRRCLNYIRLDAVRAAS